MLLRRYLLLPSQPHPSFRGTIATVWTLPNTLRKQVGRQRAASVLQSQEVWSVVPCANWCWRC